jgi:hypothetical protein
MKKYYVSKEERNLPYTIKRKKANWICHILHSDCLLRKVIQGKKGVEYEEEDVCRY